jgi:hypothetical protein
VTRCSGVWDSILAWTHSDEPLDLVFASERHSGLVTVFQTASGHAELLNFSSRPRSSVELFLRRLCDKFKN